MADPVKTEDLAVRLDALRSDVERLSRQTPPPAALTEIRRSCEDLRVEIGKVQQGITSAANAPADVKRCLEEVQGLQRAAAEAQRESTALSKRLETVETLTTEVRTWGESSEAVQAQVADLNSKVPTMAKSTAAFITVLLTIGAAILDIQCAREKLTSLDTPIVEAAASVEEASALARNSATAVDNALARMSTASDRTVQASEAALEASEGIRASKEEIGTAVDDLNLAAASMEQTLNSLSGLADTTMKDLGEATVNLDNQASAVQSGSEQLGLLVERLGDNRSDLQSDLVAIRSLGGQLRDLLGGIESRLKGLEEEVLRIHRDAAEKAADALMDSVTETPLANVGSSQRTSSGSSSDVEGILEQLGPTPSIGVGGDVEGLVSELRQMIEVSEEMGIELPGDARKIADSFEAMTQGDYARARELAQEARAKDEEDLYQVIYVLIDAQTFLMEGRYDEARPHWELAVQMEPNEPALLNSKALNDYLDATQTEDPEERAALLAAAEESLKTSMLSPAGSPEDAVTLYADVLILLGREDELLELLAPYSEGDNWMLLRQLAAAHTLAGNTDEALGIIERVLPLDPAAPFAIAADDNLAPLRTDQRFLDLLRAQEGSMFVRAAQSVWDDPDAFSPGGSEE